VTAVRFVLSPCTEKENSSEVRLSKTRNRQVGFRKLVILGMKLTTGKNGLPMVNMRLTSFYEATKRRRSEGSPAFQGRA
jgi:hypothetical protein